VKWWRAYLRQIDRITLWPTIKKTAREAGEPLETARGMMMIHAALDHAWSDLSEDECKYIIEGWT